MVRAFFTVLISCIVGTLAAGLGILWLLYFYGQDLPDYQQLAVYEPPVVSRLYAGDGKIFAEYAVEKRVFIPLASIPPHVIHTFLAAEDKNFFTHPGIDVFGIGRAIFTNVMNVGNSKALVGGSTITQQVAKNFFLSGEQTLSRKVKEAILTFRIEHALSKERILELYLNQIYLGQGAYGVGAAALYYFDKTLGELSTDEVAFLAALPKAPSHYHPDRYPEAAKRRRDWVLNRMLEETLISAQDAEQAQARPIILARKRIQDVVRADYFAEEVRRELVARYGTESLYKGGLFVRTTMNPTYQKAAEESLRAGLQAYDRRHGWRGPLQQVKIAGMSSKNIHEALAQITKPAGAGAWSLAIVVETQASQAVVQLQDSSIGHIPLKELEWARRWQKKEILGPSIKHPSDVVKPGDVVLVEPLPDQSSHQASPSQPHVLALRQIPAVGGALVAMDPHTGRVLALSGGFSFEISEFNRATQAIRQPGSAMKPIVYLAALQQGMTPSTIVHDEPLEIDLGGGLGIWRPQNMTRTFEGPITLRVALERSRNLATIDLARRVGMHDIAKLAEKFGVTQHMPPQLAMVLGAGETTVMRLTAAFAILANGGRRMTPTLIDRVQDRRGKTLLQNDMRPCSACNNIVYQKNLSVPELDDIGQQVADPIHVYQMVSILEGAVQRGTGWRARELKRPIAAKTGSTNEHKDAWCVGFTPDLVVGVYVGFDAPRTLGEMESGARVASPIFVDFFKKALTNERNIPFRIPPGTRLVQVDAKTGQPTNSSKNVIWEAFYPGAEVFNAPSSVVPATGELEPASHTEPASFEEDVLLNDGLLEHAAGGGTALGSLPQPDQQSDNSNASVPSEGRESASAPPQADVAAGASAGLPATHVENTGAKPAALAPQSSEAVSKFLNPPVPEDEGVGEMPLDETSIY